MKSFIKVLVLLIFVSQLSNIMAADDIIGTWQGVLAPGPKTSLNIKFNIKKDSTGAYSVTLAIPIKNAIHQVEATSVSYISGKLSFTISQLSASYEGISKDNMAILGQWNQEGKPIPLALFPYSEPHLSQKDMDRLMGSWYGKIQIPLPSGEKGSLTIVYRFEKTPQGEFIGLGDSPDQNSYDIPVSAIEVNNNELTVKVSSLGVEYKGQFQDNDNKIAGEFKQRTLATSLTLAKGIYKAIDLPQETMDLLVGEWNGSIEIPSPDQAVFLTTIFRFEKNEKGDLAGSLTVPEQKLNVPVTSASLSNGKITLKLGGLGEYTGQISKDKMNGKWLQGGVPTSLSLRKKKS
jgi:hypothetical protein